MAEERLGQLDADTRSRACVGVCWAKPYILHLLVSPFNVWKVLRYLSWCPLAYTSNVGLHQPAACCFGILWMDHKWTKFQQNLNHLKRSKSLSINNSKSKYATFIIPFFIRRNMLTFTVGSEPHLKIELSRRTPILYTVAKKMYW